MYVFRQFLRRLKSFHPRQVALHDETLIQSHQVIYPLVYKQIISYRHLSGGVISSQEAEVKE